MVVARDIYCAASCRGLGGACTHRKVGVRLLLLLIKQLLPLKWHL